MLAAFESAFLTCGELYKNQVNKFRGSFSAQLVIFFNLISVALKKSNSDCFDFCKSVIRIFHSLDLLFVLPYDRKP